MDANTFPPREVVRHALVRRNLVVRSVRDIGPQLRRITLGGTELEGFTAVGPEDHVKVFFPSIDSDSDGRAAAPAVNAATAAAAATAARDFTPRAFRSALQAANGEAIEAQLDIDFVLHGDSGPATRWASHVNTGDRLEIGGPRGSRLAPASVTSALLIADATALPALARWLEQLDPGIPVRAIVVGDSAGLVPYTDELRRDVEWNWIVEQDDQRRSEQLEAAVRGSAIGTATLVWAAGEATSLIAVRRYLRRELGLGKAQASVDGYWKRGTVGLDHHAPLDPSDPD